MSLMTVLHAIAGLFFLFLGILAFKQNSKSKINLVYLLMNISSSIWSFGTGLQWIAANEDQAFLWNKLASIGFTTAPGLLLIFTLLLCINEKKSISLVTYLLTFIPMAVLMVTYLFFDTYFVSAFENTSLGWKETFEGNISVMYMIHMLYVLACSVIGILMLFKKYGTSKAPDIKKQSLIMSVTLCVFVLLTIFNESILPDVLNIKTFPKISSIILVIYGIGMLYIILKYGLNRLDDSNVKVKIGNKPDNQVSA